MMENKIDDRNAQQIIIDYFFDKGCSVSKIDYDFIGRVIRSKAQSSSYAQGVVSDTVSKIREIVEKKSFELSVDVRVRNKITLELVEPLYLTEGKIARVVLVPQLLSALDHLEVSDKEGEK